MVSSQRLGGERTERQRGSLLDGIEIAGVQVPEREQRVAQRPARLRSLRRCQPPQNGRLGSGEPIAGCSGRFSGFTHPARVEGRALQSRLGAQSAGLTPGRLRLPGHPGLQIAGQSRIGGTVGMV